MSYRFRRKKETKNQREKKCRKNKCNDNMLNIRENPSHARRHLSVVFFPIIPQTLRIVALLPIKLEPPLVLGSLDFGELDAGTGSLDEDGTPPVGRGSPEVMPTVAKRDGGRMPFDAAVLLAVGIFIDGALLSDDAVGFNILDLTVPPSGFSVCASWEGMHASKGE